MLDANRAVQNGYDVFIFRMPTFSPEFTKVGSPSLSLSDIVCGSLIAPGPQELGGFHDPTLHCLISAYSIRGHLSKVSQTQDAVEIDGQSGSLMPSGFVRIVPPFNSLLLYHCSAGMGGGGSWFVQISTFSMDTSCLRNRVPISSRCR